MRYLAADLSTAPGCAAVAAWTLEQLGGIDILVDVLGGSSAPGGGFAVLGDDEWQNELNQNLLAAVRLDRARDWDAGKRPCAYRGVPGRAYPPNSVRAL